MDRLEMWLKQSEIGLTTQTVQKPMNAFRALSLTPDIY